MPLLERPDGARIHWEEAGEGPGVLLCSPFNLQPLAPLIELLAPSRRVISYDPRGLGRSPSPGPYDLVTGVADAEALLEEAGPVEVALGIGDGTHRALRLADARADLVECVVWTSTALGRGPREGAGEGFSGSGEVLLALMSLLRRDYRSGLRQMMAGSSRDPAHERERTDEMSALVPQDAAVGYLEAWVGSDSFEHARRLGGRVTILAYPGNAWFPLEAYEEARAALPEAGFELVDDGPMTRPDLTADVLLRVSAPATG